MDGEGRINVIKANCPERADFASEWLDQMACWYGFKLYLEVKSVVSTILKKAIALFYSTCCLT